MAGFVLNKERLSRFGLVPEGDLMAFVVKLICFFIIVTASITSHAEAQGKRVALVIGNSAYRHTTPLKNAGNDAIDMAAVFRDLGFEVVEGLDLDVRGLLQKVRQFGDAARGADAAVFYYAGHGLQVRGTNYLVPVDADLKHEIEIDSQAVKLDTVVDLAERNAKTTIVFLDACRDNPLARSLARSLEATRAVDIGKGLAPMRAATFGTFISFATAPNNVTLDGTGRNSPYTDALKRHIGKAGRDLSAIMIDVRNDVITATRELQVPWENSALRSQFFFRPEGSSRPASVDTSGSEAERAWQRIETSNDIRDFTAFRQQYGPTAPFFDRQAEKRIEQLLAANIVPGDREGGAVRTPLPDRQLVRSIQRRLAALGCDPGPTDGVWSDKTKEALARFAGLQAVAVTDTEPTSTLLERMQAAEARACRPTCGAGERLQNGQCVRLPAPSAKQVTAPTAQPPTKGGCTSAPGKGGNCPSWMINFSSCTDACGRHCTYNPGSGKQCF